MSDATDRLLVSLIKYGFTIADVLPHLRDLVRCNMPGCPQLRTPSRGMCQDHDRIFGAAVGRIKEMS